MRLKGSRWPSHIVCVLCPSGGKGSEIANVVLLYGKTECTQPGPRMSSRVTTFPVDRCNDFVFPGSTPVFRRFAYIYLHASCALDLLSGPTRIQKGMPRPGTSLFYIHFHPCYRDQVCLFISRHPEQESELRLKYAAYRSICRLPRCPASPVRCADLPSARRR